MTPLAIFTAACGMIWAVTSLIKSVRAGASFDTGDRIEAHYVEAVTQLPYLALIYFYDYLFWYRGFIPRPIEHGTFDYFIVGLSLIFLVGVIASLFHLLAWLRLEMKGMEFGIGPAGPAAGLYRVARRRSPTEALLDPLSRGDREVREIGIAIERRKDLMWSSLATAVAAFGTFFGYAYEPWVGWTIGIALLGPCAAWWVRGIIASVAYRAGAQFIPGAKVLEAPLAQPSETDAAKQKVHGDARLSTEQEVLAAAVGTVKRSSVHDRKF